MTIRISGLASGMSTDSVIEAMCSDKQSEIDKLTAKITNEETDYAYWEQIDTYMSMLETDAENLCSYDTWSQKSVSSTNESAVTGTATDSAETGTYKVKITQVATSTQFVSNSITSVSSALGYSGSFTINGVTISVTSTESLNSIVSAINAQTSSMSTQVKAYLVGGNMVLETVNTGASNTITAATASGDDILANLGLSDSSNQTTGVNLTGTINGVSFTSASNSVTAISGLTLNVTDTGSATISITHDYGTIKSLLKTFVDDYNTVMSYMSDITALNVSSTSGALSSTKGALAGDITAYNLQSKSRELITTLFSGTSGSSSITSLNSLGIWTSGTDNQLSLDSETLVSALENNFDSVKTMLRSYGNTTTSQGTGIMRLFYNYMSDVTDPTDGCITTHQGTLEDNISSDEDRLTQKKKALSSYEEQLYLHYAAMETMVANYNSQGSYLSSLSSSSSSS